ncbi:MAG TPA: NIPSNAP family protein [Candidatus Kapabacteria bacterium]|nr:NIPSNAP family protein [Candidatus Kapabacteria bacterium]
MFVVRDIFYLKFGAARDARAALQGLRALNDQLGYGNTRALNDFTGHSYRLILESTFATLAEYEERLAATMAMPDWREGYAKFVPLVERSEREILRLIE